jgi:hypothetical protein
MQDDNHDMDDVATCDDCILDRGIRTHRSSAARRRCRDSPVANQWQKDIAAQNIDAIVALPCA